LFFRPCSIQASSPFLPSAFVFLASSSVTLKKSSGCSEGELWLHLFGVDTALEQGVVPTPRTVQAQAEDAVSVQRNMIIFSTSFGWQ
jgi:hypothetical protein